MKNFSCPALLAVLAIPVSLPFAAHAQSASENDAPVSVAPASIAPASVGLPLQGGAARVVQVEENSLAGLPALLQRGGGPGAISLRVSEEAFNADPAARDALMRWVRGGGTVFLHTGAARAFGFKTVAARLGTNALAGQLYGRARAALPFGAHPLLWDDGQSAGSEGAFTLAAGTDPTRFPGVNVVFYELREGDDLVVSHPAGTPLLEVSDLAANPGKALYAAALAPFGRGYAVFTPDLIDQKRGDGALFARNLLNLLSSAGQMSGAKLVGVSASAIENGGINSAALQRALSIAASSGSAALPAFGTVPNATGAAAASATGVMASKARPNARNSVAVAPADNGTVADDETAAGTGTVAVEEAQAQVILTRAEANSYARLLAAGGERGGAAINLLRARLFLSRGDAERASASVEASAGLAPNVAEVALWRGILLVDAAQNTNQPSPLRAQLLNDAARNLAQAGRAKSIVAGFAAPTGATANGATANGATANGATANGATAGDSVRLAGITLTALRSWSAKLGRIARIFALEPPLVQQFGTGQGAITVRAVAEDTSLRLIVPGAQALANSRAFGWHGDNEEVLLFPTPQSYENYRRFLNLDGPTVPLADGAIGDVLGQRILMLALPSSPVVTRNPRTGVVSVLGTRNGAGNLLARLHASVLLRAFDESGRAPAWLQLGLEGLGDVAIAGNTQSGIDNQVLQQVAGAGGLLSPQQFSGVLGFNRPEQLAIAQAQATSLMAYFYRAYGAGAVTETIQRVGAGQSIDEALQATTQGDETALFENWRGDHFGPQNFPNAG